MDEAKLAALLADATAHCYDEEDRFWGVFSALVGGISFPLQATVQEEGVTLVRLDGHNSAPEVGVMVIVDKGTEETVALADVEAIDPDPASTEWVAAYRYWLSQGR